MAQHAQCDVLLPMLPLASDSEPASNPLGKLTAPVVHQIHASLLPPRLFLPISTSTSPARALRRRAMIAPWRGCRGAADRPSASLQVIPEPPRPSERTSQALLQGKKGPRDVYAEEN